MISKAGGTPATKAIGTSVTPISLYLWKITVVSRETNKLNPVSGPVIVVSALVTL